MSKRSIVRVCLMVVCALGMNARCVYGQAGLIGHWPMDESDGMTAADVSGMGKDGTLANGVSFQPDAGMYDGALFVDPGDASGHCEVSTAGMKPSKGTLMVWAKLSDPQPAHTSYLMGHTTQPVWTNRIQIYTDSGDNVLDLGLGDSHTRQTGIVDLPMETWFHIALTWDIGSYVVYMDAVEIAAGTYTGLTTLYPIMDIGNDGHDQRVRAEAFGGLLDEMKVFDRALTPEEIAKAMVVTKELASDPSPAVDSIDVPRKPLLTWEAGEFAVMHDVYIGMNFDDVNTASVTNPLGTQVAEGLTAPIHDPGYLDFGQTYYWRVDEVNGAPDRTVFQGQTWSFTVEPMGIPVESITATASGANLGMEASNTINGSGLDALGQHSTMPTEMWLTGLDGSWIQYAFDKPYKLHEMLVWNSNQAIESFIGFSVKDAIIETSLDGETWTVVDGAGPFAKATGLPTYTANTVVDLSGIVAQYVKISPQSAHGMTGQAGLSELRFLYIPTVAREPDPAHGSVTENLEVTLTWRSGREAVSHEVALSTDRDAIVNGTAAVETVSEASYPTDSLVFGTTYYWQVTEVNEAEAPAAFVGDIWSYTTSEYIAIDDFESFSGDEGAEVYMTWWDGFGGDDTLGGSTTGHIDSPFVETVIVNPASASTQSLPMFFDNNGGFINIEGALSAPTFSEVVRDLDGLDLTEGNAEILAVSFQGDPNNGDDPLYLIVEDNAGASVTVTHPDATAIQSSTWQDWLIPMTEFDSLRENNIKAITIGVGYKSGAQAGSEGVLYIDDLRKGTPIQ